MAGEGERTRGHPCLERGDPGSGIDVAELRGASELPARRARASAGLTGNPTHSPRLKRPLSCKTEPPRSHSSALLATTSYRTTWLFSVGGPSQGTTADHPLRCNASPFATLSHGPGGGGLPKAGAEEDPGRAHRSARHQITAGGAATGGRGNQNSGCVHIPRCVFHFFLLSNSWTALEGRRMEV